MTTTSKQQQHDSLAITAVESESESSRVWVLAQSQSWSLFWRRLQLWALSVSLHLCVILLQSIWLLC